MTKTLRLLALLLLASPVFAQAPRTYTQPELDQMLAPVALYPDALLSQVLMAATYPVDVIEAARWSRANPGLQGDDAVRAVAGEDWDPSVKSLVAFPQLLARMDEQLEWMRRLGEAFVAQEPQVMDTVQQLRARAQAAGALQSSEQVHVQQQGPAIVIQPAAPQVVYVPYYEPLAVYGPWWWPAHQPVAWAPWPGYARPYRAAGFWWGQPVGLSVGFFFGNFDWHHRHVRVVRPSAYYYHYHHHRPPVVVNRTVVVDRGRWQHDPHHRRHVDHRAPEERQRFAGARVQTPAQRQMPAQVQTPAQAQPRAQPAAQPRAEQRIERREPRHAFREPARIERREVRQEQRAPAAPIQAAPGAQAPPQTRMPAAVAPPQPRAQRPEPPRGERRNEPRAGGRQRS